MKSPQISAALDVVAGEGKPWDMLPGENPRQWAAFQLYRDLGSDRSLGTVAEESGYNRDYLTDVSITYRWEERARAWDAYLDLTRQQATVKETITAAVRQARLGIKMQELANKRLQQYAESEDLQATMTVGDTVKLAAEGIKIERQAESTGSSSESDSGPTLVFHLGGMPLPQWASKSKALVGGEIPVAPSEVVEEGISGDSPQEGTARPTTKVH